MRISNHKCNSCGRCVDFCCGEAIRQVEDKYVVDENKCFECYLCLTPGICPVSAFEETPLSWPRIVRNKFSSVHAVHSRTGIEGRGTAEMKNNDVTGRYGYGVVGFTVDVGRPGIGATFEDVEKISMAVAKLGVEFEPTNPTTRLMTDKTTGRFRADIKMEWVLSCILEFKITEEKLISVIDAFKDVARSVNTVFSVGCISRCRPDGTVPAKDILDRAGVFYRPNGKINIGLGRPLAP